MRRALAFPSCLLLTCEAAWITGQAGESCTAACNRTGDSCDAAPMQAVMAACTDSSTVWRLLNSVWSSTGDAKTCTANFMQLVEGSAPVFDSECIVSSNGQTSCDAEPNATFQRLCCCATGCTYDAGYCAEGYTPNSGNTGSSGSTVNEEEMQTWAMIAGFCIGLCCVLGLGGGLYLGRHMMYTRVRNKALNRLDRAAREHQKRSEGDAEASEGSEEMDIAASATVAAEIGPSASGPSTHV